MRIDGFITGFVVNVIFHLGSEFADVAFDLSLESLALEAETAHRPVGVVCPREEGIENRRWRVDSLPVGFLARVVSRAREAASVELTRAQRSFQLTRAQIDYHLVFFFFSSL